jgi:hypothetical protein
MASKDKKVRQATDIPSISIYQNAGHVTGVLQQLFEEGILTAAEFERSSEAAEVFQKTNKFGVNAEVSADVPIVAKAGAKVSGNVDRQRTGNDKQTNALRQQYVYSHSFYLQLVMRTLRQNGWIRSVSSDSDARDIEPGEYVEFQASFRADEIGAILDIATPELVGAIAERHVRGQMNKLFDSGLTFDERQNMVEKYKAKAEMQRDFARAIAEAIRVDFRSDATQEYFGTVGDGDDTTTAVVVCENDQFLVADKDRLLDGRFTVFGKVATPVQYDVPLLQRNKLLYRLNANFVDEIFGQL